ASPLAGPDESIGRAGFPVTPRLMMESLCSKPRTQFMHEIPLITTIALALSAALLFGLIARRLRLSPIVGYLIAGVLIGPYTPGVVGDAKIAAQFAEIGVILLMFGVG